jgi:cytochrome c-type biogenesis protein CcmF
MRLFGEICLLTSLAATGYAAFLSFWLGYRESVVRRRIALAVTAIGVVGLTVTIGILVVGLATRDFRFKYVAEYVGPYLPMRYCLSALWVGQAGSLLLWTWITACIAVVFRFARTPNARLRHTAFGLVMLDVFFLLCVIVFAADPMTPSVTAVNQGVGLSPLLQHPSMLVHPPIVFMAYSLWAVPCALGFAALITGQLNNDWTHAARSWALAAWTLLGVGLLLGAHWAYQELGWGGYWGWDPVENGSFLPWLTGTALIHSLMAWRRRSALKKTAVSLAIVTFSLCNFATFLTRSGIFSSVHAFSESPIGWMFLGLMSALIGGGAFLIIRNRGALQSKPFIRKVLARETLIAFSIFLVLSLAAIVLVGTLIPPLSKILVGRMIEVGPAFYNNVLPPIALSLLSITAIVPLLRWGGPPDVRSRRLLSFGLVVAMIVSFAAWICGVRHALAIAIVGLVALSLSTLLIAWFDDASRQHTDTISRRLYTAWRINRRRYAAYCIHLGFVLVAMGVAGSSLGTQREEMTLDEGAIIDWAGHHIRYVRLQQRELPDKLVGEALLQIESDHYKPIELRPARHFHFLQNEWTSEVAIHSTWGGDLYTVLNAGLGGGKIALTLVNNPMIRWIWVGGVFTTVSAIVALLPNRRIRAKAAETLSSSTLLAETLAKDRQAAIKAA